MKKIIPIVGLAAGAAALVVYKMKKDEQKRIVDLDQGLLVDEDETIEEGPINPEAYCECAADKLEDSVDTAAHKVKNLKERTEDLLDDMQEKVMDVKDVLKQKIEQVKDRSEEVVEDVQEAVKNDDSQYPHLSSQQIAIITANADAMIDKLIQESDVLEHERPVQHIVQFTHQQDLDAFKHEVINKGFVISNGEQENECIVLHITSINKEKLYDNMFLLANAATEHAGEYQGWNTKVVYK